MKQWWDDTKAKSKSDNITRLRDSFHLKEKDGNVWVMHEGVAVFKVPAFASCDEAVVYLEESRGYAVECAYGIPYEQGKGNRHIWGNEIAKGDSNLDPNCFVDL